LGFTWEGANPGSGILKLFVNDTAVALTKTVDNNVYGWRDGIANLSFGGYGQAGFTGNDFTVDEFWMVNGSQNTTWLNVTYHGGNQSTGFITLGTPVTAGSGLAPITNGTFCINFTNATECCTPYYWSVNISNATGEWYNESFVFTTYCPVPPTNVVVTNVNSSALNVTWTKGTNPGGLFGDKNWTHVRYSATGYPADVDDGTLLYNGTNTWAVASGLLADTTYYFSLWTYYEKWGHSCFSGSRATKSGSTAGGTYNLTFRWECNYTLLNATGNFTNSTITFEKMGGRIIHTNTTFTTNPLEIVLSETPDIVRFDWNNSGMIRSLTPRVGEKNLTFYICCYPEWDAEDENLSAYQFWYTFDFNDYTADSIFQVSPESKLYIFKYNTTSKLYIHQDFWSSEDMVRAVLHYGERYYLGIECDAYHIPFLQYIDTASDFTLGINILPEENITYDIHDFASITLRWEAGGDGMWINYTDAALNTISGLTSIYIIYRNNDTSILKQTHAFVTSLENYQWTTAAGCNQSADYYIVVNVSHELLPENGTLEGIITGIWNETVVVIRWLNDALN